jgi:hypothetical protein
MGVNVTNITDYQGNCIKDYEETCVVLSTHVPIFGCGAVYARIWQAGISTYDDYEIPLPDIRLISEL